MMGRKRIDWQALQIDYNKNDYANLKEFAETHDLNWGTVRNRCAGWAEQKACLKKHVRDKAVEFTIESDVMTAAERNTRHVQLWDAFLNVVHEGLEDYDSIHYPNGTVKVAAVERLANIMEKAQKGQRLALDMDKENKDAKGLLSEISAAIDAAKAAYDGDGGNAVQ